MSWQALIDIIVEEAGTDMAAKIIKRARLELGGLRITINKRATITAAMVDEVAPGKPKEAARHLGVHPATVYRALHRKPLIR
jgi:hypothetical protein